MAVVADTHALVWYLTRPERLSDNARDVLNQTTEAGEPIYLSVISLIEIIYLVERNRLPSATLERLHAVLSRPDSALEIVPLDTAVANAVPQVPGDVVREMPDRLIGATALYLGVPLVTRDRSLQATLLTTIW